MLLRFGKWKEKQKEGCVSLKLQNEVNLLGNEKKKKEGDQGDLDFCLYDKDVLSLSYIVIDKF